ncbi:MAG: RNA-processing protein [Thermoplasmatales archaeon]|nr:MAG: RNA-processing protein [Thermoplasmatales archaeon]
MKYLKIPRERIGVLIGHNGETKKKIEEMAQIQLEIDSDEGEVTIDEHEVKDPLLGLQVEDVIRAIGRGFSPEHAMRLFREDADFFIFDIHDYVGKKQAHIRRLKSRIIGRNGKTKHIIERLTGADISIYGHTVSVIADFECMDNAKKAIDMLLSGSKHSNVYRFVEREMKKLRRGARV